MEWSSVLYNGAQNQVCLKPSFMRLWTVLLTVVNLSQFDMRYVLPSKYLFHVSTDSVVVIADEATQVRWNLIHSLVCPV